MCNTGCVCWSRVPGQVSAQSARPSCSNAPTSRCCSLPRCFVALLSGVQPSQPPPSLFTPLPPVSFPLLARKLLYNPVGFLFFLATLPGPVRGKHDDVDPRRGTMCTCRGDCCRGGALRAASGVPENTHRFSI